MCCYFFLCVCARLYLKDLTAVQFDLRQFKALALLRVTVLLQVTLSGLHLRRGRRRERETQLFLPELLSAKEIVPMMRENWISSSDLRLNTWCTLQMWSLREPLSLNGRMSRAEDSLVLENNSGQRYGVYRGGRGGVTYLQSSVNCQSVPRL